MCIYFDKIMPKLLTGELLITIWLIMHLRLNVMYKSVIPEMIMRWGASESILRKEVVEISIRFPYFVGRFIGQKLTEL
jgi:hypothetical protein